MTAFERAELIRIFRGFKDHDDEHLIERLRNIVYGHEMLVEERPDSSGRDFGFELAAAPKFVAAGLPVDLSHEADLKIDMCEFCLFGECKRLKPEAVHRPVRPIKVRIYSHP